MSACTCWVRRLAGELIEYVWETWPTGRCRCLRCGASWSKL